MGVHAIVIETPGHKARQDITHYTTRIKKMFSLRSEFLLLYCLQEQKVKPQSEDVDVL